MSVKINTKYINFVYSFNLFLMPVFNIISILLNLPLILGNRHPGNRVLGTRPLKEVVYYLYMARSFQGMWILLCKPDAKV